MIRKRLLSACLALALCLGLLPVTAEAAVGGAPSQLYVGDQQVSSGNDITYWTTDKSTGGLTKCEGNDDNWNVKYDPTTVTLTLSGASIQGGSNTGSAPFGSGIYALCSKGQSVALTIELIGTNTITGYYGIYVNAEMSDNSYGTDASLTITGENNESLKVSGSYHGIYVKSGTGDASLNINDASVVASSSFSYSGYAGVYVQSSMHATSSPQLSLKVNGGSLTTSGSEGNDGIQFDMGSSEATGATTSLTVSDNAIVRANGGIKASRVDEPTPSGTGIVFDGTEGTVYGDVTLEDNLTIGEDESLKLDSGASLNTGEYTLKVDGGTLTGDVTGTVIYKVTGVSLNKTSTELTVGQSETLTATITPDNATNKNVTWSSDNQNVATVDANGNVTAVGAGTAQITVTTADGSFTDTCQVTINAATVSVTGVTLDKAELTLTEGGSESLVATITPDNAANKTVTWTSSNPSVATVNNGVVTAVGAGEATITVTTADGGFTAECTVTVRGDVPDRPVNIPDTHEIELIAGEGGEAKTSLTNASAGTKITVTATPDAGYELAYITVNGERISGVSFTMPDHDVTVRVYFSGVLPFADVAEDAWYYDAVSYVYANGLMDGVSATTFAPDANMTRAMVWTVLARIDGETITGESWKTLARAWAVENGISDGSNADALITREQMVTMLYRYAGAPVGGGMAVSEFTDGASVSDYATDAITWALSEGILAGMGDGALAPQGTATRAQAAAMLMRFAER